MAALLSMLCGTGREATAQLAKRKGRESFRRGVCLHFSTLGIDLGAVEGVHVEGVHVLVSTLCGGFEC